MIGGRVTVTSEGGGPPTQNASGVFRVGQRVRVHLEPDDAGIEGVVEAEGEGDARILFVNLTPAIPIADVAGMHDRRVCVHARTKAETTEDERHHWEPLT